VIVIAVTALLVGAAAKPHLVAAVETILLVRKIVVSVIMTAVIATAPEVLMTVIETTKCVMFKIGTMIGIAIGIAILLVMLRTRKVRQILILSFLFSASYNWEN
jgi:mannose/fructose/N-acetylgalactosamine-specific phosphotransferase system component IIC